MTKKTLPQTDSAELRRRAEELLQDVLPPAAELDHNKTDTLRLLHELQVHQIELEMQNAELCQARDEVEKLLKKYTDLYDFAPVGYVTLDRKGAIRSINLTGAGLLGIERSRLIGRRFEHVVATPFRPEFAAFLVKAFASPNKEVCEAELVKDGKSSFFVQVEAVADASGDECRVVLIDISERRQAEEEIKKLNADLSARTAELENTNQELAAFNYMASHDLGQPLNNIFTSSRAIELLCGDRLDEENREFLHIIQNSAMNMNKLIGTLLRFSQSEHAELFRKMVDLSDMARVVAAGLKLNEPGRQVEIKIEKGLVANGDPELLQVVLNNLFSNAWKYTGNLMHGTIEFGSTEIDGRQTYFIRDNGPGFDMQEAKGLFLPFNRMWGVDKFTGHGIGLATVEKIIRRHGGKVWALGEPGRGATFFFTLGE